MNSELINYGTAIVDIGLTQISHGNGFKELINISHRALSKAETDLGLRDNISSTDASLIERVKLASLSHDLIFNDKLELLSKEIKNVIGSKARCRLDAAKEDIDTFSHEFDIISKYIISAITSDLMFFRLVGSPTPGRLILWRTFEPIDGKGSREYFTIAFQQGKHFSNPQYYPYSEITAAVACFIRRYCQEDPLYLDDVKDHWLLEEIETSEK